MTEFQESQAVGLIASVSRVLPNNTILIYDLGVGTYGLRTVRNGSMRRLICFINNGTFFSWPTIVITVIVKSCRFP